MAEQGATCVAVDVRGPAAGTVGRLVEGALGWQVVAVDDVVLPARCQLVDVEAALAAPAPAALPRVLLVAAQDDPARAAQAAVAVAAVVGPEPTVAGLRTAVAGVGGRAVEARPWCTVGAGAGGVGATTVAAALAGLRAWTHGPTLLAVTGPPHVVGAPAVEQADLASPAVWAAAAPAPAVEGLRVVRWALPPHRALAAAGGVATVAELGVAADGAAPLDVLVVRPDGPGRAAVEAAVGAPAVVVVGRGPLRSGQVAAGAPVVVELAWSARVAAAAAAGRLPAGLPGRWLRPLVPLVAALEQA